VTGSKTIRPMTDADLELVLSWRNHPDVRSYMYTQHEISLAEHKAWFERTKDDPERHLLIFQKDSIPLGFINIHQISSGGIADWGFYIKPGAPKGSGQELGGVVLDYAFNNLRLHKLCGQALAFNKRSIEFHKKLGFSHEGTLADQHFDGQQYHAIWCFGLTVPQWQVNN